MSHTVSGQATGYTWDVAASLPEILKDNANTYVYGLDLISATDASGNQKYYMHNGIGSVSVIAEHGGGLRAEYYYSEFGLPSFTWEYEPGSNDRRFAGEQRDADSGFNYLRARYYDPAIGRFLSKDPLPTGNLYAYVDNNPVNSSDPSGLCPNSCEGAFGGSGCTPLLGCWSINYGGILEVLPEYLACVAFGVALAALLLENPWLAAVAVGIDAANTVIPGDEDAAKSTAAGAFAVSFGSWYERAAKTWKPKNQRWDEMGFKGLGKTLSWFALGYSGWGCAKKVGILSA